MTTSYSINRDPFRRHIDDKLSESLFHQFMCYLEVAQNNPTVHKIALKWITHSITDKWLD